MGRTSTTYFDPKTWHVAGNTGVGNQRIKEYLGTVTVNKRSRLERESWTQTISVWLEEALGRLYRISGGGRLFKVGIYKTTEEHERRATHHQQAPDEGAVGARDPVPG